LIKVNRFIGSEGLLPNKYRRFYMTTTSINRIKKPLFGKPLFYYMLAVALFICAVIIHPWDYQYKEFITAHRFLDIGSLEVFLSLVRVFGNGGIAAILALIFAAYGYKKLAYRIVVSLIVMGIIVNVLKPVAGRERPNEKNNHSFPSGDTATAAAFFPPMTAKSNIFIPGAIILTPAVGFLRTYDNWHWLSDVFTGMGIGFLAAGFALYFCEKKNRFYKLICCKIKPRYYAIISVIVLLSCFLPELISGGGKYFSFTSFFAPSLYVWLIAVYIPFIFNKRSEKCKPVFKPVGQLKQYFIRNVNNQCKSIHTKILNTKTALYQKQPTCQNCSKYTDINFSTTPLRKIVLPILAVILVLILIVPPWIFDNLQNIAQPSSGIGIGIIVLLIALYKIKKSNNHKRIKPTLTSGIFVLIIFTLLTLIPAIL
jgi:membrane-associated phospholipid phosphatase